MPMIKETVFKLVVAVSLVLAPARTFLSPLAETQEVVLVEHNLDLTNRAKNEYTNEIFVDNILLSLHHLNSEEKTSVVDWEQINQPFEVSFTLEPGAIFAFHDTTYPEFSDPAVTMNTEFSRQEGYKVLAGLAGNGVCHLASLMNLTAQEVGLEVVAKVKHDFVPIPEMPRENGTSIRTFDKNQNLYIKNTFEEPVIFSFSADKEKVNLKILAPNN